MAGEWWYCLKHNRVEDASGCANTHRMGPYEDRQQAERALQTAAERTEAWEHDPRWNDDEDGGAPPGPTPTGPAT